MVSCKHESLIAWSVKCRGYLLESGEILSRKTHVRAFSYITSKVFVEHSVTENLKEYNLFLLSKI